MTADTEPADRDPFEAFWAVYPPRTPNPKAPARAIFKRRVRFGDDPELIVRAAKRYAEECRAKKLDLKFVPHARTWLSQRRDEDYPDPPAAPETPAEWDGLWARLKDVMTEDAYRAWIKPCRVQILVNEDRAVVTAPNRWHAKELEKRLGPAMARGFAVSEVQIRAEGETS